MGEVPLDNNKINTYLSKSLKLKEKQFGYEIIEIASDNDFKKVQCQSQSKKPLFFQIIHECGAEDTKTKGIKKEITIQPNHYSLLVYYNNEVYYFDPSYDSNNLHVCNKIKERFENKNIHIMETRLQTDRYTCGTYVCEFIRQIVNKYHKIQDHTINETGFKMYLQNETDSNGDFMLLAQSGDILNNFLNNIKQQREDAMQNINNTNQEIKKLIQTTVANHKKILTAIFSKKYETETLTEDTLSKHIDEINDIILNIRTDDETKSISKQQLQNNLQTIIKHKDTINKCTALLDDSYIKIQQLQSICEQLIIEEKERIQILDEASKKKANKRLKDQETLLKSLKQIQIESEIKNNMSPPQTIQKIHKLIFKNEII
ncbi:MAG: hypothetical protein J6C50_00850 [Rickettsiales bacterium]|nr:hypothetical protein [Rickettsiales bacterium]